MLAVFISLVISGTVSGIWTHRWAKSTVLNDAVQKTQLPSTVGDWEGREEKVSPAELKGSQAAVIVRKTYVDRKTGIAALVTVICGQAGPVSVHTPDVCFPGSGYAEVDQVTAINLDEPSGPAKFFVRKFQKASGVPVTLCVYYSWNDGNGWQAPENPRFTFAGCPVLFKLYVTRETGANNLEGNKDPALDLIHQLVPLVGKLN
jgi:hypothetical protein